MDRVAREWLVASHLLLGIQYSAMAVAMAPASAFTAGASVQVPLCRASSRQRPGAAGVPAKRTPASRGDGVVQRRGAVKVSAASRRKAVRRQREEQVEASTGSVKRSGAATTVASPDDGAGRVDRDPPGAATGRGSDAAAAPSAERPFEERTSNGTPAAGPRGAVLAPASRENVLSACAKTAAFMAGSAVILRQLSAWAAASGYPVNDATALVQLELDPGDLGLIAVAIAAVSAARLVLLQVSSEFAVSSDRSNAQVLSNLSLADIAAVAALSGASEELLFRGAMLPILGLNWVGIIISGSIFGTLHLSGGRNAVFAVWATAVGVLYGWLTLASESAIDPMIAHSVANLVAALVWKFANDEHGKDGF